MGVTSDSLRRKESRWDSMWNFEGCCSRACTSYTALALNFKNKLERQPGLSHVPLLQQAHWKWVGMDLRAPHRSRGRQLTPQEHRELCQRYYVCWRESVAVGNVELCLHHQHRLIPAPLTVLCTECTHGSLCWSSLPLQALPPIPACCLCCPRLPHLLATFPAWSPNHWMELFPSPPAWACPHLERAVWGSGCITALEVFNKHVDVALVSWWADSAWTWSWRAFPI